MDKQIHISNAYENYNSTFENVIAILKLNAKVDIYHTKDGTVYSFEELTKYELHNLEEAITNRLPFLSKY